MSLEVPRMSDDELRTFVLALCDGKIFTMHHVPEDMIGMVFMPIGMGAFADVPVEELKQIGTIYEYIDQAGPRSVNGMPMFLSFKMVHIDDWTRAREAYDAEMKRRKEIPV